MNAPESIKKYERIIQKEAWFCWHRLPSPKHISIEDLCAEANLVYVKSLKYFQAEQGNQFITFFVHNLKHRLGDILVSAHKAHYVYIPDEYSPADKQENTEIKKIEFPVSVSQKAKSLFEQIINPDSDFRQALNTHHGGVRTHKRNLLFRVCNLTPERGKRLLAELEIVLDGLNMFPR